MTDSSKLSTPARNVSDIRAHFPALDRQYNGQPVAYFDGPGGTQVPRCVAEAMVDYLYHHNANTHWMFPTSQETDEALARARHALADFLNATPAEIAFGANMTSLTFHVSRSLGREYGPRDEIVVTELDHHANIDPWTALERERGVAIRVVQMNPETGQLDWSDLERSITDRTRLVAIGAASNALGTINDVGRAARLAHLAGALVFVDAVHYAPHRLVDVRSLGCDFLACSSYKFYGPHLGILYGKRDLLQALDVPKIQPAPDRIPDRLETGTQNHEGIVGAAAAVDFLASLAPGSTRRQRLSAGFDVLRDREMTLLQQLWRGLSEIKQVQLFGPAPDMPRTPTASFRIAGRSAAEVGHCLAERGLFVSHGDFYATTAVNRLGMSEPGLVRVGISCYTTLEEVERLLDAARSIAAA
jgi:cysteine desulfurase family protein (TIGR01976 family)